jgi:small-conductance mechanosensitive channel
MMTNMKQRLMRLVLTILLATPLTAMAASSEEERIDARVENYQKNVKVEDSSTTLSWLLLIVLTGMAVAVVFKSARRTHLD